MGTLPVRLIRRLSVVVLSLLFPASISTGCTSCEAKCAGPQAEIFVSNDIAAVTVCDSSGTCAEQSFGTPGTSTVGQSFTISAVEVSGSIPLTVSGTTQAGDAIAAVQVLAKATSGSCGCKAPAHVFVDITGVNLPSSE